MDIDRRLLVRALVVAVVVEHILLVISPLNVLAPLDPWVVGQRLLHGQLPYRDFAFEYPPLAALAFILPGLVPHGAAMSVLALQEVAAEAAVAWFVLRRCGDDALIRYGVLSLLVWPFLSGGFDALPMAAIAFSAAWLAAGRGRGRWAAAVGTLIKVVPGVAWVWGRTRWRAALAALVVTIAVGLAPLLVAHDATSSYLGYAVKRGVQVESVAASTTWLTHRVTRTANHYSYRFKSWQIAEGGAQALAWEVAAALGMFVVFVAAWRRRLDPWMAALATVLLFLCGSKVLSPQFVAWAAPVAAVLGGPWFAAYAGVAGLTFIAYALPSGPGPILAFALVRNAVLVGLTIAAVRRTVLPRRTALPLRSGDDRRPLRP